MDELRRTGVTVLLKTPVDAQDIHQLVSEVVLGPLPRIQGDGGAHGDRRDRQHGEHGPLGAGVAGVTPLNPATFIP